MVHEPLNYFNKRQFFPRLWTFYHLVSIVLLSFLLPLVTPHHCVPIILFAYYFLKFYWDFDFLGEEITLWNLISCWIGPGVFGELG